MSILIVLKYSRKASGSSLLCSVVELLPYRPACRPLELAFKFIVNLSKSSVLKTSLMQCHDPQCFEVRTCQLWRIGQEKSIKRDATIGSRGKFNLRQVPWTHNGPCLGALMKICIANTAQLLSKSPIPPVSSS